MIKLTACFGCIFTMDNKFLAYQSLGGVGFRVLRSDIEAVDVDVLATGGGLLRLIGKGTELARVELPGPAAEKAAAWISEHRQGVVPAGPPIRPGGTTPRQFARAMAVLALIWCFLYAVGRLLVDKP